jgi:uncharacterized membrane protein
MSSGTSTSAGRRRRRTPPTGARQPERPKARTTGGGTGSAAAGSEGQSTAEMLTPRQLAVLGTMVAASAGVLVARGSGLVNTIFVVLAVSAAGVVASMVYRTLAPLSADLAPEEPEMVGGRTRAALERDKALTLRAIKELEFDHAMGKVSDTDFQEMGNRLRARAMRLIRQLDSGSERYRELIERELGARLGKRAAKAGANGAPGVSAERPPDPEAPAAVDNQPSVGISQAAGEPDEREELESNACGYCGATNDADARFCKRCGTKLGVPA